MKQTAVEWLEQNMPNISKHIPLGIALEFTAKFQQAKKMEKEQLCYFYVKGAEAEINNPYISNIEFYNKTFKSE